MKFYLIVAKGKRKGMPIPISIDLFLIGSDKMCQLRKDNLGEKQCALVTRENKVFLRDFDSGHLSLVNGEAIPPGIEWPLHAGDRIEVGTLEFIIQYREKALSQRDLEEWAAGCLDVGGIGGIGEDEDEFHQPTDASSAAQSIVDRLARAKGEVKGRLRVGIEAGVTVVRVSNEAVVDDSEIALIKTELCQQLNRQNLRVLIDLKNVRRMSSAGLIMLTEFNRWLAQWGSRMAMCRIHRDMTDVLVTLNGENIPQFASKETALAAKW